jgi:integrase
MARIRERAPGVWEISVSTGRRDPVTGRYGQLSRTVRTGATRPYAGKNPPRAVQAAADKLATEAVASAGRGTASSVEHLLAEYLRHQANRGRAPKTLLEYRRLATSVETTEIGPAGAPVAFGSIELRRLTAAHVDELQVKLKARGLSDTSRHHHHAVLSQALNQAVKWEWLERNPARAAEAPPLRPEERTPPTPEQVKHLLATITEAHPDLAAFIFASATTGCRRGELCALRWSAVDLASGEVLVAEAITDIPDGQGGPQVKDVKNHKKRRLALDELTVAVLEVQKARAAARCQVVGAELAVDAYVWSQDAEHDTPWRPGRVTGAFMTARDSAGMPHVQLKDLRHFATTQMLAAGVDVRTAAGRQGHDPAMTLRVYGHRIQPRDQAAAQILGALLATPQP